MKALKLTFVTLFTVFAFGFALIGVGNQKASAAPLTYDNVRLTPNDKVVFTRPVWYEANDLGVYVQNTSKWSFVPHIVSWSVTDSKGKVIAEGTLDPGTSTTKYLHPTKYKYYTLSLTGYTNAYGYGSLGNDY